MPAEYASIAADLPDPFRLLIRETAGSTNDVAGELGRNGAADGLVVLAEQQTAGRGRRGAAWFSPAGESLAFSVLVRPSEPRPLWPRLALAAGLAVAEAVESLGVTATIKWPNDVWIRRRKVAGILVEAGEQFAVVGIGINAATRQFPPEVAEIATSLVIEGARPHSLPEVLLLVLRHFAVRRMQLSTSFPELLQAVRVRCALTGNQVSLVTPEGPKTGWVQGIAAGGELLLRTERGLDTLIQADEVRLLSP